MNVEAITVVVNAHRGLLEAELNLVPGQKIRLSNLKTEVVAVGKVLKRGLQWNTLILPAGPT